MDALRSAHFNDHLFVMANFIIDDEIQAQQHSCFQGDPLNSNCNVRDAPDFLSTIKGQELSASSE